MSDWCAVHERGISLGKRRARQDHEELCWMVEALELRDRPVHAEAPALELRL